MNFKTIKYIDLIIFFLAIPSLERNIVPTPVIAITVRFNFNNLQATPPIIIAFGETK